MEPQLEGIQQPQLLPGTDPNEHIAQAMSSRELQEVFDYDAIPQEALQRALSQNDQVAAIQTPSAPLPYYELAAPPIHIIYPYWSNF